MDIKFNISGMTCAACSARVEKVTCGVAGVAEVNVNLLKNSMKVVLAQGADAAEVTALISAAVAKAGYGAQPTIPAGGGNTGGNFGAAGSVGGSANASATASEYSPTGQTQSSNRPTFDPAQKRELRSLIVSIIFTVPLFYLAMGPMLHLPVPLSPDIPAQIMPYVLTQLILLIPVVVANRARFIRGFKALFHLAPNMDSLVCLGATASIAYGLFATYRVGALLGVGELFAARAATGALYFDSAAMILTLICVGKYLEARAKGHTTDTITALMDLSPQTAIVRREGAELVIPTAEVRIGDQLVVKAGASIPCDGIIIEGSGAVDESAITGESIPVDKVVGDPVTGATINTSAWFVMEATHVGADTALAHIIALVDEATGSKAPIERIADKISGVFVPVVIAIALITLIIWLLCGSGFETALNHAISILVISCPCALGLATPTAIMVGTGRGAAEGILIKSAETLERAGKTNIAVFDKTGTITKGRPEVSDIILAPDHSKSELLELAHAIEARSEHPLARAIVAYAEEQGFATSSGTAATAGATMPTVEAFEQVPGQGVRARINGKTCLAGNLRMLQLAGISLDTIASTTSATTDSEELPRNLADSAKAAGGVADEKALVSAASETGEKPTESAASASAGAAFAQKTAGLAAAGKTPLFFACDGELVGTIALLDGPKPGAAPAMQALRHMGIRTVMLTGDNLQTAQAIQAQVACDQVIAEVLPQDKAAEVVALRKEGTVAMIGDGVNDAPALASASIGVAIGSGTDVAIEAADIVLMHSDPQDVPVMIDLSRATMRNIKQNLFWALFYNVICIPIAAGALAGLGVTLNPMIAAAAMGLSSLFVVGNALRLRRWKPERRKLATASEPAQKEDGSKNKPTAALTKQLQVEGMMCEHCVKYVTRALEGIDKVTSADVDLEAGTALAHLSAEVPDELLIAAVVAAGYEARID